MLLVQAAPFYSCGGQVGKTFLEEFFEVGQVGPSVPVVQVFEDAALSGLQLLLLDGVETFARGGVETDVDGILLCSDGLTNMLDNAQILKVLESDLTIQEKLNKLIIKCNNRGGTDNISIAFLAKDGD